MQNTLRANRAFRLPSVWLWLALLCATATAGCHATLSPILNVQNANLVTVSGQPFTDAEARAIIVRALLAKHWSILGDTPGVLTAQVASRGHSATIRIDYTATSYSISHVESTSGLKYDGTNIHKVYNNWIKRLTEQIQAESAKGPGAEPTTPPPAAPAAAAPAEAALPAPAPAEAAPATP